MPTLAPAPVALDPEERVDQLVGSASNPLLRWRVLFELAFAGALICVPPQDLFGMGPLGLLELAILAVFPVVVWGSDERPRAVLRRRATGSPDS